MPPPHLDLLPTKVLLVTFKLPPFSIQRHAKVWRAGDVRHTPGIATGFPLLDGLLPNRGWPDCALTEILTASEGVGALRLVLPAIARLSQTHWIIWVCPPHVPFAPALQAAGVVLERLLIVEPEEAQQADIDYRLWVFEQALRFPDCGAAMVWLGAAPHISLRRQQLACEQGRTWGVMFRPASYAIQASPASLRLSLEANAAGGHQVRILKAQSGARMNACKLDL